MKGWGLTDINRLRWEILDKSFSGVRKILNYFFKNLKALLFLTQEENSVEAENKNSFLARPGYHLPGFRAPEVWRAPHRDPSQLYWSLWLVENPLPGFGKGRMEFSHLSLAVSLGLALVCSKRSNVGPGCLLGGVYWYLCIRRFLYIPHSALTANILPGRGNISSAPG